MHKAFMKSGECLNKEFLRNTVTALMVPRPRKSSYVPVCQLQRVFICLNKSSEF